MPYIVEIPKNQISIIASRKINNSQLLSFNFTSINDGNLSRALFVGKYQDNNDTVILEQGKLEFYRDTDVAASFLIKKNNIYKLEGDKKIEYHPDAEESGSNLNPYAKSFVSKNPPNTNITAASIPLALTQHLPSR